MFDQEPNPIGVGLALMAILVAFAVAGAGDYADAVAQENRELKAKLAAAHCQVAADPRAEVAP